MPGKFRTVTGIRPYRHARGLQQAEEFIRTFHSGIHSFEIWVDEKAKVVMWSSYPEIELKKRMASFYPTAETYTPEIVDFEVEFVARATLSNPFYPLRTDVSGDPLNAVLASMTGHRAIYQVVFTPASPKYAGKLIKASRAVSAGRVEGWVNPRVIPAGKTEKDLSKEIAEKAKSPLYYAEIRLCADSKISLGFFELFKTLYQGFRIEVYSSLRSSRSLSPTLSRSKKMMKVLKDMMARDLKLPRFGKKSVLSAKELSLLAHVPGEEVVGDVEWTYERKDVYPPVVD